MGLKLITSGLCECRETALAVTPHLLWSRRCIWRRRVAGDRQMRRFAEALICRSRRTRGGRGRERGGGREERDEEDDAAAVWRRRWKARSRRYARWSLTSRAGDLLDYATSLRDRYSCLRPGQIVRTSFTERSSSCSLIAGMESLGARL